MDTEGRLILCSGVMDLWIYIPGYTSHRNGGKPLKSTGPYGRFLNSTRDIRLSDIRQGL